jgi:hypothetical protein
MGPFLALALRVWTGCATVGVEPGDVLVRDEGGRPGYVPGRDDLAGGLVEGGHGRAGAVWGP